MPSKVNKRKILEFSPSSSSNSKDTVLYLQRNSCPCAYSKPSDYACCIASLS